MIGSSEVILLRASVVITLSQVSVGVHGAVVVTVVVTVVVVGTVEVTVTVVVVGAGVTVTVVSGTDDVAVGYG
jgi:hypothetical protein